MNHAHEANQFALLKQRRLGSVVRIKMDSRMPAELRTFIAEHMGAVPAVVAGAVGTLVVVALWAWVFPELRRVDQLEDAARQPLPGDAEPEAVGTTS